MVQQKLSALKNWQLLLCHLIFFNCSELTSKILRILYLFFEILLGSEQLQINIDDGSSLRIRTCMWWESGVLLL